MAIEYNQQSYSTRPHFLVFPDHYVCVAQSFAKDHGLSTVIDGRKIIKAGTPYPANDGTAIGLTFNDMDVTDGDVNGAVLIHGFVNTAKMPVVPASAAKAALMGIQFLPLFSTSCTVKATKLAIDNADTLGTEYSVVVTAVGDKFRPEASVLANWTFTGEATAKVAVQTIVISTDGSTATLNLEATAATEAGTVTARPAATAMMLGVQPSAAIDIATVASGT